MAVLKRRRTPHKQPYCRSKPSAAGNMCTSPLGPNEKNPNPTKSGCLERVERLKSVSGVNTCCDECKSPGGWSVSHVLPQQGRRKRNGMHCYYCCVGYTQGEIATASLLRQTAKKSSPLTVHYTYVRMYVAHIPPPCVLKCDAYFRTQK